MRNISKCELFSGLCGDVIPCAHPEKKDCGFQFYTNEEGETLGLCKHRKDELGFKKCWEEMRVLLEWKRTREKESK